MKSNQTISRWVGTPWRAGSSAAHGPHASEKDATAGAAGRAEAGAKACASSPQRAPSRSAWARCPAPVADGLAAVHQHLTLQLARCGLLPKTSEQHAALASFAQLPQLSAHDATASYALGWVGRTALRLRRTSGHLLGMLVGLAGRAATALGLFRASRAARLLRQQQAAAARQQSIEAMQRANAAGLHAMQNKQWQRRLRAQAAALRIIVTAPSEPGQPNRRAEPSEWSGASPRVGSP